jgi:hypothetical protein
VYLQDHEFRQLHAVFEYLFESPYALNGSWASSTYRYAPRYIRRGPLLLQGRKAFEDVYVIVPPEAAVTPVRDDSQPGALNFPTIENGEAIRVTKVDGPWWDLLRSELAAMSAEMKTHQRVRQSLKESRVLSEKERRDEKFQQAADVVSSFLPKPPES